MVMIRTRNITQDVALMDLGDNDIVIPILGATGAGKSSFINAYMKAKGQRGEAKVGDTLVPCTVGLEAFVVDAHGRRVVLVDTPGFDNPAASDKDIMTRVGGWLRKSSGRKDVSIGGVVYLQDITQDRITGTARTNLHLLKKQCAAASLDKVVLVTSKWGRDPGGMDLEGTEEKLKNDHWKSMINPGGGAEGARVMRLRAGDEEKSASEVVDSIVNRVVAEAEEKAALEVDKPPRLHKKVSGLLSGISAKMRHRQEEVAGVALTGIEAWVSKADILGREGPGEGNRARDAKGKLKEIERKLTDPDMTSREPLLRRVQGWLMMRI